MKRIGLKGQCYRTPESIGTESVKPSQILTHRLDFVKAHYGVNNPQGHGGSDGDSFDDRKGDRTERVGQVLPRDHYLFLLNSSVFNYMLEYERMLKALLVRQEALLG